MMESALAQREEGISTFGEGCVYEPWNKITQPGAYIFLDTGDLVRVPKEALALGHSPIVTLTSRHSRMLARITSDPYIPLNKARQLAADADLPVNF